MARERYARLDYRSPIRWYEVGEGCIKVWFGERKWYLYGRKKPGIDRVNDMIELARQGKGLAGYISEFVREQYEDKGG